MKRRGDEFGDMNELPLAQPTPFGHQGSDAEVAQFLAELRGLGQCTAPTPSPELTALLGSARPMRRRALRIVSRTAAAAAAAVAASVVAAANHDLPAPAQRVVSNVVNVLTPFHIDPVSHPPVAPPPPRRPADREEPGTSPEPRDSGDSGSEPDERPARSGQPSRSAEPSDGPSGSDGSDGSRSGGGERASGGERDSTGGAGGGTDG